MMTIDEMKNRKEELMYTCAMISEKSGLPLSTVQKVFCGATSKPRRKTMEKLELVLKDRSYSYEEALKDTFCVREEAADFPTSSERVRTSVRSVDCWIGEDPSERWPKQGSYTVDDYLAIPDEIRAELIDGVIYDLGAPGGDHQIVMVQLAIEFDKCIQEHEGDCEVMIAPFDVRLDGDDKTMVEPDLMIICPGHSYQNEYTGTDAGKRYNGAPDLVVEVLSPSTRRKDCTIKLRKYMNAGVREYWIVDIKNEKVIVYRFDEDELPTQYTFDDSVAVGISEGRCSIEFGKVKARLEKAKKNKVID